MSCEFLVFSEPFTRSIDSPSARKKLTIPVFDTIFVIGQGLMLEVVTFRKVFLTEHELASPLLCMSSQNHDIEGLPMSIFSLGRLT